MTDVSLVICTRNRAGQLRRTLQAVGRIEAAPGWEVVVVENACTDRTPDVIEEFGTSASIPVRRIVESAPGKARALNAGCRAANGTLLVVTDDDCYPEPDLVDAYFSVFEAREVGYAGGRVLRYDQDDPHPSLRRESSVHLRAPHTFSKTGFICGANMAFRKEVWRAIGGFDEQLGPGTPFSSMDIEFCARASDSGWPGGYFPDPTVYHDARLTERAADELRHVYDRGRGAYYAKVLLDMPTLRRQCLKWWYWDLEIARPGQTRRELLGAADYLLRRGMATMGGFLP